MTSGQVILVVLVLIVAATAIASIINRAKRRKEIRDMINREWGKVPGGKCWDADIKSIASYFTNLRQASPDRHYIDDITWNDLDMDRVFKRLNATMSTVGEEYLYSLIREPCFSKSMLEEREKLILLFQNNPELRKKLQYILGDLGKRRHVDISNSFFEEEKKFSSKLVLYRFLQILSVSAAVILFVNPEYGLLLFVPSFLANVVVYYRSKNMIGASLEVVSYIASLVNCSKKIISENLDEISDYNRELKMSYRNIKAISRKAYNLFYTSGDVFLEYFKIVLLKELVDFESINTIIYKHREDIKRTYEIIGLMDSLISIASYRESVQYYTAPDLSQARADSDKTLCAVDIYHPLIKDPVANSIVTKRSVLVSGSNASGKSTFLKTVAVNAIFAQTIHTCLAKEYCSNYFKIFTSMALRDDLMKDESYFIAEIKSLKRILDQLNDNTPCLCFIDEVLRGTNTVERIAASSRILFHINRSNCLCFVATHDIEITNILKNSYENYHFREKISKDEVIFDYKLYSGNSKTRNAIKLLSIMGFDISIVKEAEDAANSFLHNGSWGQLK